MKKYRIFVIFSMIWFLFVMILAMILAIALYLYDPLQIFHKPYFRETTFSQEQRLQNFGIIKHYDFDSYIVGTSMVEHIPIKELNLATGANFVNVMMYGSDFHLRSVILKYIFKTKTPKMIVYSIDENSVFLKDNMENIEHFSFLYNDDWEKIKIYLNDKFFKCLITWSLKPECIGVKRPLETLNQSLIDFEFLVKKFGNFQNWVDFEDYRIDKTMKKIRKFNGDKFSPNKKFDSTSAKNYTEQYLLSFIKENEQTQFLLIIPPYSRLHWRLEVDKDFYLWRDYIKWLVKELETLPNAKIFGFDDMDYPDDISNYTDATHYNVDMHKYFVEAIKENKHILDSKNIDLYFDNLEKSIESYDLTPLIRAVSKKSTL